MATTDVPLRSIRSGKVKVAGAPAGHHSATFADAFEMPPSDNGYGPATASVDSLSRHRGHRRQRETTTASRLLVSVIDLKKWSEAHEKTRRRVTLRYLVLSAKICLRLLHHDPQEQTNANGTYETRGSGPARPQGRNAAGVGDQGKGAEIRETRP